MVDDIHRLGIRNLITCGQAAGAQRSHPARPRYRCVPYMVVTPGNAELANLAADVYTAMRPRWRDKTGGPTRSSGGCSPVGAFGEGNHELLSYLIFNPDYAGEQIERGQTHAIAAWDRGWQIGPP